MTNEEKQLNEFNEISDSIRHYSNLRFAVLTLFFAFAGAGISFLYGEHPPKQSFAIIGTQLAGIVGSLILWFFEYRIQDEFLHLERRAATVEKELGYDVYRRRTRFRIRMFWLTSIFFGGVILFWCISFFQPPTP